MGSAGSACSSACSSAYPAAYPAARPWAPLALTLGLHLVLAWLAGAHRNLGHEKAGKPPPASVLVLLHRRFPFSTLVRLEWCFAPPCPKDLN